MLCFKVSIWYFSPVLFLRQHLYFLMFNLACFYLHHGACDQTDLCFVFLPAYLKGENYLIVTVCITSQRKHSLFGAYEDICLWYYYLMGLIDNMWCSTGLQLMYLGKYLLSTCHRNDILNPSLKKLISIFLFTRQGVNQHFGPGDVCQLITYLFLQRAISKFLLRQQSSY